MAQQKSVRCIGIILDGNRRWARERGLPIFEGHRRGFDKVQETARWVRDRNIPHLVLFAFSTENWKRTAEEVRYLMDIFRRVVRDEVAKLGREGVRVRFLGERERFSDDLQRGMAEAEEKTKRQSRMTLWVCLSYGARAEITAAVRTAAAAGEITEEMIRANMWSAEMPDPDIVIRTSGEHRLSNFLLWQAAYSELFFIKPNWPDFSEADLDGVLAEYAARERRIGV